MTEIEVPVQRGFAFSSSRSSSASSVASSYSSAYSSVRRMVEDGKGDDYSALSEALERLLASESIDQIARLAVKTGIPQNLRARVWPLLLQSHPYVLNPCIAHEFPVAPESPSEKRLRGEIKRLMQKTNRTLPEPDQARFSESIYTAVWEFLNKYQLQHESGYPWVAWALATAMGQGEIDSLVFEQAMLVILHTEPSVEPRGPGDNEVANTIAHFMTVFRYFLPEVSGHFDREFMLNFFVGEEWLVWWIKWYGAKAFAIPDLSRLWDCYFGYRTEPMLAEAATPLAALPSVTVEPRTLHVFAALALLKANSNKLMELDQSEAHHLLTHLPLSKNFEALLIEAHGMMEKWKGANGESSA